MHILLFAVAFLALLVVAGLLYQVAGVSSDRRRFPPPGSMVDIGRARLHLLDAGEGSPTVLLESGISASCLNWTHVRTQVARFTRVLSYDRASLGWSDAAVEPRTLSQVVSELHALLTAAKVAGPLILVGHSFGGLMVRAYSVKYPDDVAGLILIDPLSAGEWLQPAPQQARILRLGARLSRRGALLARLGVVRASLAMLTGGGFRWIPQTVAKLSSGRGESAITRLVGEVRKMPPETWPMVQSHWCQPKTFLGMSAYFLSLPESSAQAAALGALPQIPVTILSAASATPAQLAEREGIVRISPRNKHLSATQSGHWIHLDQPELVIGAIHEMVLQART